MPTIQQRLSQEMSTAHSTSKSAAYSMSVMDTMVRCDSSAGSFVLTLPSVAEAFTDVPYVVKLVTGAGAGTAPNTVTVRPKGKESVRWQGDLVLQRPGQYGVFVSDGEQWHKMRQQIGSDSAASKYFHEMWNRCPILGTKLGGVHSATLENTMHCASGMVFSYMGIVGQTLMPQWADPGLDIAGDQVAGDGWSFDTGVGTGNPYKFVVGTDPAFFTRVRMSVADVSGWANLVVGFRKLEAKTALYDDYNDLAGLNLLRGAIRIDSIKTNAATVNTDTTNTMADLATITFEVRVSAAGAVTYLINDVAPTVVAAYTFTDALTVIPFIQGEQHADLAGATVILEWEGGYL